MLRAVRFAAKLDMTISPRTAAPIAELASLLQDIPPARLFEETLKLFLAGDGLATYKLLREYGLFQPLFPQVAALFTPHGNSPYEQFIEHALADTDARVREDKRVNPAFLYATLCGVVSKPVVGCWRMRVVYPGMTPSCWRSTRCWTIRCGSSPFPAVSLPMSAISGHCNSV